MYLFEREAALDFSELFMFYPVPFCSVYTHVKTQKQLFKSGFCMVGPNILSKFECHFDECPCSKIVFSETPIPALPNMISARLNISLPCTSPQQLFQNPGSAPGGIAPFVLPLYQHTNGVTVLTYHRG